MRLSTLSMTIPCAMALFFSFLIMMAAAPVAAGEALQDRNNNCPTWAESGECDANPDWMRINCATSCTAIDEQALRDAEDVTHIKSFFDLEAKDIGGDTVKFNQFEGKITVITNVASYCSYTDSHYRSLISLHNDLVSTEKVEILAFPCNQFGKQDPEECSTIKKFAEKKGVEFRMMDKIDVNGPDASPVYKYLKKEGGVPHIRWNFSTYFVVGPEGNVKSYSGVEPHELKDTIIEMIN